MLIDDVERIIHTAPGLTATQIARKLYGHNGYGERVRAVCQTLHAVGRIDRAGKGGPGDPFRFHPVGRRAIGEGAAMPNRHSSERKSDIAR